MPIPDSESKIALCQGFIIRGTTIIKVILMHNNPDGPEKFP